MSKILAVAMVAACTLVGCELAGEAGAAALEGEAAGGLAAGEVMVRAVGEADVAAVGARAGAGAAEAAGAPIARAFAAEGAAESGVELASRSMGAEPETGWAEHFDKDGAYKGYSEFTRSEVRHFDDQGNFDGRELRGSSGSTVYNRALRANGRTDFRGSRTLAYDANGAYKGYSERAGSRVMGYDKGGTYTGYSVIKPWPKGFGLEPIAVVAGAAVKRRLDVSVSSIRFFTADQPHYDCRGPFIQQVSAQFPYDIYIQVDVRIPIKTTSPVSLGYRYVVSDNGVDVVSGTINQTLQAGWTWGCTRQDAFRVSGRYAGRYLTVRLLNSDREVARSQLYVAP